jgi:tetratricopeptide (TPR) repeat protein
MPTIEIYTSLIEKDPQNAKLYIDRGICHIIKGNKIDAKNDFIKAIEFGFNNITDLMPEVKLPAIEQKSVYFNKVKTIVAAKQIKKANEDIKNNPKEGTYFILKAILYIINGEKEKAKRNFIEAIDFGKDFYAVDDFNDYYTGTGQMDYFACFKDREMILSAIITCNFDSTNTYLAYKERANCRFYGVTGDGRFYNKKIENTEDALSDYNKIIELSEQFQDIEVGSAYYSRGLIHKINGDFSKAINDFHIVKIKNDHLISKFKNSVDSVKWIDGLVSKMKIFVAQRSNKSIDQTNAITALITRSRLENADAYFECCKILHQQNDIKQLEHDFKVAENEFNNAIGYPSFNGLVFLRWGKFYIEFDKKKEAAEKFNKAIDCDLSSDVSYVSEIGELYFKKGYLNEANQLYNPLCVKLKKESINFHLHTFRDWEINNFGDRLFKLGLLFEKEKEYELAILYMSWVEFFIECSVVKANSGQFANLMLVSEEREFEKCIIRCQNQKELSNKDQELEKSYTKLNISDQELEKVNQELRKTNKELEKKTLDLERTKGELEDIMAMFAHKFRGPLQNIMWNVDHQNHKKVSLEAVKTMNGLLDIFSTVSTSSEHLQQKLITDKKGDGSVSETLNKSIVLAVSQALSQRNIQKTRQHFIKFAKQKELVPENITRHKWSEEFYEIEANLQKDWETEFMNFLDLSDPVSMFDWIEQHFCKFEIEGFDDDGIWFQKYGPKESIMIIIFVEMLLNAIKYYDSDKKQLIKISWKNTGEHYEFVIENPSSPKERDIDKGSGKGHHFLRKISQKLGREMPELEFADIFIVSFPFDNNLMI